MSELDFLRKYGTTFVFWNNRVDTIASFVAKRRMTMKNALSIVAQIEDYNVV